MGISIILDILLLAHGSCWYLFVALMQLQLLVHHANDCFPQCRSVFGTTAQVEQQQRLVCTSVRWRLLWSVQGSYIKGSVIGCNSFVANGCHIDDSLLMGNDNYSNDRERERARQQGLSVLGIGASPELTA